MTFNLILIIYNFFRSFDSFASMKQPKKLFILKKSVRRLPEELFPNKQHSTRLRLANHGNHHHAGIGNPIPKMQCK